MCGSRGACLDRMRMLLGARVTTGLGFFCLQVVYEIVKTVTPCYRSKGLVSKRGFPH